MPMQMPADDEKGRDALRPPQAHSPPRPAASPRTQRRQRRVPPRRNRPEPPEARQTDPRDARPGLSTGRRNTRPRSDRAPQFDFFNTISPSQTSKKDAAFVAMGG